MRSVVILATLLSAAGLASPASAESVLIPAERIYTSPDAPPLANGTVLLRDRRIGSVADERSRIAVPDGTVTSECRGVLVAGFQNSHVHLMGPTFDGAAGRPAAELEDALESMLTRYGFTTVFDTGSDLANTVAIRARIDKGEIHGPRILTAGWPVYPTDGIPFYLAHLPKHVLAQLRQPKTAAEARDDVRGNFDAGADGAKIFMVTSPARDVERSLAPDVASAVAEETHARGKLLLAHPTNVAGIRAAVAAGVDVIVHTTLGERTPWDPALTREMVAKKMSVIPTFKLWYYELAKGGAPAEVSDRLVNSTLGELQAFVKAGGQVLFGTDVGYMDDYDPALEYELMAKAGLTPAQILASLTTEPAKRWKEDRTRGRVEPGFDADLVVLAGDPFEDVRNFANVRCVFRGGRQVYPAPEK